jgi:glycosyltransferase involved in cell wall biosynthesis
LSVISLGQVTVINILASDDMVTVPLQPTLSVVIASHYPISMTRRCIDAILQRAQGVEIIVARDQSKDGYDSLKSSYPEVTWIDAPTRCPVPELRFIGWQASSGEYIAFIEDDCIVSEDWLETALKHHRRGIAVVGGSLVADDYDNLVDWAMFLCEYARFTRAVAQKVKSLPGNNTSYKRSVLSGQQDSFSCEKGIYDVFLNGRLTQVGVDLFFDADMAVKNINRWSLRNLTLGALHHGRCYAYMRLQKAGMPKRLLYAALTPLLPPLLMLKLLIAVSEGQYLSKYMCCLPQTCLFYVLWASGEFLGSVAGPADSARYWS